MIGDADRNVSDLYGMIHPNADNTLTVRSVFVIGPDHRVKLTLTYPASTGRNFNEILRVIDSLQLTDEKGWPHRSTGLQVMTSLFHLAFPMKKQRNALASSMPSNHICVTLKLKRIAGRIKTEGNRVNGEKT